jgi:ferredoxin-like protein FixX
MDVTRLQGELSQSLKGVEVECGLCHVISPLVAHSCWKYGGLEPLIDTPIKKQLKL